MSYGLRTWNEVGGLTLDTNTFTYQILGSWVLDFTNSTWSSPTNFTLSIPGYDPSTCGLILLPTRASDVPGAKENPSNAKAYPFVTTSAGQAVIKAFNPSASSPATLSPKGIFRAMAVKYR